MFHKFLRWCLGIKQSDLDLLEALSKWPENKRPAFRGRCLCIETKGEDGIWRS